jgi:hypothetical protein
MTTKFLRNSMAFKLLVMAAMFLSVAFWQKFDTQITLDAALSHWDTENYKNIAYNGYILKDLPFPENIKLGAFYPGLVLIYYIGNILNFQALVYVLNFVTFTCFCYIFYRFISTKWVQKSSDVQLTNFLFCSFCLFPFSAFLHFNYTEIFFLTGAIWSLDLILDKKIWKSQIPALIIGFFRPTALPFGVLAWLLYTIESFKDRINFSFKKYVLESFGFLAYAIGTLCLYAFNQFKYGNWKLFFDSQQFFYKKQNNPDFINNAISEAMGNVEMWYNQQDKYSDMINTYGFYFYDKEFNLAFLLWFPFTVAVLGSIVLLFQKRFYWIIFSWGLLLPTLLSNTTSFNRYLLISFPLILAFNGLFAKYKGSQYWLYMMYSIFFLITIILFTHGFWVG